MAKGYIKEINFTNVETLIDFLTNPKEPFSTREQWIFRGQGKSEWGLDSSLARVVLKNDSTNTQREFIWDEMSLLNNFLTSSIGIGLELPTKSPFTFNNDLLLTQRLQYIALAQHYGLPTRLLDWSFDKWIALYFALDLSNLSLYSDDDKLSLWCFKTEHFELGSIPYTIDNEKYKIHTYNPSFHNNLNANAQKGLFTYISNDNHDIQNLGAITISALDALKESSIQNLNLKNIIEYADFPTYRRKTLFAYKLNISRKYTIELKDILWNKFIGHTDLFPDYKGVCESIMIDYNLQKNNTLEPVKIYF